MLSTGLKRQADRTGTATPDQWLWLACLVIGALVIAVYLLDPHPRNLLWASLNCGFALLPVVGVLRYRPADPLPWYLLAAGGALLAAGDILQWSARMPVLWWFDAFYVAGYALLAAALQRFVHARTAGRDLPALLDALTITIGLGLLLWALVLVPSARVPELETATRIRTLALPLAGLVLLAMLIRLWNGGGERRMPFYLLALGTLSTAAGDVLFSIASLQGAYRPGGMIDAFHLLPYAAFGAAALHPAMASMTTPTAPTDARPSPLRLAGLTAAALVPPAMLVVEWARGQLIDVPVIAAACVALFLLTLWRMSWLAAEVTRQNERKRMFGQVLQATEDERTRIATDLHDGPVQSLAVLSYTTHRARKQLARHELAAADDLLESMEKGLEEEVRVLRRLMADLRPPVLDDRGLEVALREHAETFERETGVLATMDIRLPARLGPQQETILYRVVQEALVNVAKHAAAEAVWVALSLSGTSVSLRVTDDGRGFQLESLSRLMRDRHYGLAGMRERVTLAGGKLRVRSTPGRGTTIGVVLPAQPT
ncbi:MAG TPA: sensor histidine kinase [Actinomycetes bacterium]|nr:sensor histidine kinase [Actinomycetes bacterium]